MAKSSKPTKSHKTVITEKPKSILPSGRKDASFFEQVYDVVRLVPKGRVTSYGAVAAYLGTKMSARMVGWAMNGAHHVSPKVPAHRVVNRNGMLSGKAHFATPTLMEELLAKEKVFVKDNLIQDFKSKYWDPSVELSLD
jgi:methylated-DNA-protein-cysteine methyltransferase-like protein